ncbi:hypothetical protein L484_015008 [Morus notabilis]|uniref:CASP-like protein n=1 Tax=Morus notabilis TaxID=981085 RepID=W9S3U0_9ROSA|nr:hypothetical protein L484_015008 [Morus notabilis]
MESQAKAQTERANQQSKGAMKKSSSRNSDSSGQMESPHSPLRFHSPLRSEAGDPPDTPPYESPVNSPEKQPDNSRAIVAVEKANLNHYSSDHHKKPHQNATAPAKPPLPMYINRATKEEAPPSVTKVGPVAGGSGGDDGGVGRRSNFAPSPGRRPRKELLKSAALGFRVSEFVLCLISFSVMAADKTQGWSGDSFDRYKEYRFCLSVNVIAFVYSLFQAYDLAFHLVTGKHVLAYLLISASSSAATRVDDWQSNWGKDEFTEMASASVGMAFLAFAAFAVSSLISGYNLWSENTM